ncbi:protein-L-isoaspartate(D-aspartate) O-methyltransferase [Marinobacter sp. SS21]|uniref:protein-L-isoaspartate(D-aspartate) O-methyltransferase n=1 Tax=Marinobacter sp. SS21 TaxID=2979460 RepID=UPI00232E6B29|nr:protein-L-isoaspartate(D-aspartate) O-methyltransferase [Marinobacter sp. SS21]MDC0663896.1 protein-L-isoaspartate(D-aspartate) O-methyltransferase [Marinobacter sp. SS21]
MVEELQGIGMTSRRTRLRLVQRLRDHGIRNERVLEVMTEVPRHIFLDEALSHRAYEDTALPIGYGQTLSQPYIVAKMTEILLEHQPEPPKRVLELGTGSGYQTAILAKLVAEVFSVERIKPLQDRARDRLRKLSLRNAILKHADGGIGWVEKGPFDGIIVTAAPKELSRELMSQLADGGIMVAPVGEARQMLVRVVRQGDQFVTTEIEPVRFVPLLGGVVR